MKNLITILLALVPTFAYAEGDPDVVSGFPIGNGKWIGARDANNALDIKLMSVDSSDNTVINAKSGKSIKLSAAETSIAEVNSTGLKFNAGYGLIQAPYVPTMAATPVAGTNVVKPGLNVVPTAAANTAAFIGGATPVPGETFRIVNASGQTVRLKAAGGATLNGATAGGYIAVPNLATVDCTTASTSNQVCLQPVIPTPAGP